MEMRIRGIGRLRHAARQVKGRFARQAVILTYHRIAEVRSDPWALCVRPQYFAEQLEVLRRDYHPLSLQQLTTVMRGGDIPRRAVVVTFDDGYANNLSHAKPLLERYEIPATVFLTAGAVGHEREFWDDELDRLLLQPGTLPEALHLSLSGRSFYWQLGEAAHYREEASQRHHRWRAWEEETPTARHVLYRSLYQLLLPLPDEERCQTLNDLRAWAGAEPVSRSTHRFLSREEVAALAQGGLIEIGSHTMTHPVLSECSAAAQRGEIEQSKARLEEALGHPVTSFAYPYGKPSHYTAETVAIVREAGFDCACARFGGVVRRDTDPFQLPRFHIQDYGGEEFARQVSKCFVS